MSALVAHDMDVLTVVGARPQFIKSVALTRALAVGGVKQWLVHAGQHPDDGMGLDFLAEMGVSMPDARLHPNQQDRTRRLADMMSGIASEIEKTSPRAVIVYGDTDSTLAGALAAHHMGLPLVHVEAGLRSGDRRMPEEHNRILTDQLSDLLCTTGPGPSLQLASEGVEAARIVEVGDVMLDVALAVQAGLPERFPPRWPKADGPVLAVTLHRPATVDHPALLAGALEALGFWCRKTGGKVYFPVHPRTAGRMEAHGLTLPEGVLDPGPLGYLDMQSALFHADGVLTDSGGVQKEAWYQGSPAVILRDSTEWKELLDIGASTLFDPAQLVDEAGRDALVQCIMERPMVPPVHEAGLFGGGRAAARIVDALKGII